MSTPNEDDVTIEDIIELSETMGEKTLNTVIHNYIVKGRLRLEVFLQYQGITQGEVYAALHDQDDEEDRLDEEQA